MSAICGRRNELAVFLREQLGVDDWGNGVNLQFQSIGDKCRRSSRPGVLLHSEFQIQLEEEDGRGENPYLL